MRIKSFTTTSAGRIVVASSADVYTSAYFALQNACWGMPQAPFICIFQCRLRIPSGRFLPGDVLWVVQNLHEVRSGFCKRIVLYLFRNRRIQKRNAPRLHTVRKFFLCLQCCSLTHIRGGFCIQNVGCGVFSVAIFRQLHHGIVVSPEVAETNPAADFFHSGAQLFFIAPFCPLPFTAVYLPRLTS